MAFKNIFGYAIEKTTYLCSMHNSEGLNKWLNNTEFKVKVTYSLYWKLLKGKHYPYPRSAPDVYIEHMH